MFRLLTILGLCAMFMSTATTAEARHRHRHHHHHRAQPQTQPEFDFGFSFFHRTVQPTISHGLRKFADKIVYLPHPSGCPRTNFCACGASVEIFGHFIRSLWPSRAWFKFPRSEPGFNKVAVRNGHVFVLKRPYKGNIWWVKDFNSGGHKSRFHLRSIAGYRIVNPQA